MARRTPLQSIYQNTSIRVCRGGFASAAFFGEARHCPRGGPNNFKGPDAQYSRDGGP